MNTAQKRRDEIEAKKAKLAELKRLRGERQLSFPLSRATSGIGEPAAAAQTPRLSELKDINDLVDSLVGEISSSRKLSRSSSRTSSGQHNTHTDHGQIPKVFDANSIRKLTEFDDRSPPTKSATGGVDVNLRSEFEFKVPRGVVREPMTVTAIATDPPVRSKEIVTYSKGTQTQTDLFPESLEMEDDIETQEQLIARLRKDIEAEMRIKEAEEDRLRKTREVAVAVQVPDISEDNGDRRTQSDQLSGLASPNLDAQRVDYTKDPDVEPETSEGKVKEIVQFFGETTKRRTITSIDWSSRYNELLLASYSKNSVYSNEAQGIVLVWNCKSPKHPEFSFNCQGEVQKAIFSPHHPNYIVGGTYSGQVILWDTRATKEPVLKTPLTGKGHTYPITGLNVIGTRQANSIVSTSSDGTVCSWSIDMLAQPQESIELALLPPSKVEEVAPTAVSHTPADTSVFLVGTEDGNVYSVNRQDRAGVKAGIDPKIIYKGHAAMVTGIHHHPKKGPIDLGDFLLTSSLDWTIRLWRIKSPSMLGSLAIGTGPAVIDPLFEFQKDDMVYDVRWSPQRPGVFASVDGTGECHVHDICQNYEVPVARMTPSVPPGLSPSQFPRALNKVAWNHDEGKRLAVGGVDGVLTVFEMPESLGGKEGTSNDQWFGLNNKLKAMGK